MSVWVITGLGVLFLVLLALWRGVFLEKNRRACLTLACEISDPLENTSTVITRANEFEKFVRYGKEKPKTETPSLD